MKAIDAPPPLPNGAPVVFGAGLLERLSETIAALGGSRVLLVRGRRSFELSGAAEVVPALEQVAEVVQWSDFETNTDAKDLARGLRISAETDPDLVLAIGGGSVLDMGKLLCAFDGTEDDDELRARIRSGQRVDYRRRSLVLVPTTSGSGSEATHFAVLYIGQEKFSVAGPALRPDAVVLDPELSVSGSPYQRATSGIDAVCQAIESLWAVGATADSRGFACGALDHLLPSIEGFVASPTRETATSMAIGSHLAGRAIDLSKTTAAHALSYAITQRYGVSHGHAVALTLGPLLSLHSSPHDRLLRSSVDAEHHGIAMATVLSRLGAEGGGDAHRRFVGLMTKLGLVPHLSDVGVEDESDLLLLAQAVNEERLLNNPVDLSEHDVMLLLREAF